MPESRVTCTKTAWVQLVRNDFHRVELRMLNEDGTNPVRIAKDGATPPGATLLATDELIATDPRRGFFCYAPTAAVIVSVIEGYTELGRLGRRGGKSGDIPSTPPSDGGGGSGGVPGTGGDFPV